MESRREVIQKKAVTQNAGERRRFLILLFILFAVVSAAYMLTGSVRAEAAPPLQESSYKYYTSIQIQEGDTLWRIASDYMTEECGSLEAYMDEICKLNHISGDSIHSGRYLTIPYYSSEYIE